MFPGRKEWSSYCEVCEASSLITSSGTTHHAAEDKENCCQASSHFQPCKIWEQEQKYVLFWTKSIGYCGEIQITILKVQGVPELYDLTIWSQYSHADHLWTSPYLRMQFLITVAVHSKISIRNFFKVYFIHDITKLIKLQQYFDDNTF